MEGAGLRAGAARARVVELLASEGQCLIGVLAIVDRLRANGASGSQASVYRVLDELLGLGLVRRSNDEHGVAHYEIADPETHHHHFVDDETGAVEPFEDASLERAITAAAERAGIELTGHEIVLRGSRRSVRSA
jgi:Fur family transcriptional regulator, ferric uptake regulator